MKQQLQILSILILGLSSTSLAFSSCKASISKSLFAIKTTTTTTTSSNVQTFSNLESLLKKQKNQERFQLTMSSSESAEQQQQKQDDLSIRGAMRKLTGFSLTAFRLSARATTASMRATLRGATGVSMTGVLSAFVGIFPLWVRTFFQPFLILYYTPLMILRSLVGNTRTSNIEARQAHEHFVEGWKNAVQVAEKVNKDGYWPVHVNEDGGIEFVSLPDPKDVLKTNEFADAIVESVEIALEENEP